jgi:cobalt-precorrin-7 (C5)-methyltransferase
MTDSVQVVGIGPGALDYLTPTARHMIAEAEVVLGYDSVVSYIESITDATLLRCSYDTEADRLDTFANHVDDGREAAAVAMGDPTVSGLQFIDKLDAAIEPPLEIVPGISSIQIATARAQTPLEASTFVTLHKRDPLDADLDRSFATPANATSSSFRGRAI